MVAAFGSLPVAAKVGVKALVALPFTYHSINGLRHLVWDVGTGIHSPLSVLTLALNNKAVIRTGYTVMGLTGVATIALALM